MLTGHIELFKRQVVRLIHIARSRFQKDPSPYVPDYSAATLAQRLGLPLRSSLQLSEKAFQRKSVEYFREKMPERFFATPEQLRLRIAQAADHHPDWCQATKSYVAHTREVGLGIYDIVVHPLGEGFPWSNPTGNPSGDSLYKVRPHRFAFAPSWILDAAYRGIFPSDLKRMLRDFQRHATHDRSLYPFMSSLVVIQRAVAITWAIAFTQSQSAKWGEDGIELEYELLSILAEDVRFLESRIGSSYPNNHLLIDYFAGWYLQMLVPEFFSTGPSHAEREHLWITELKRQTLEDGGSFEHSIHYHEFSCEAAVAYAVLMRRNQQEIPSDVAQRIRSMLRFQAAVGANSTHTPMLGNATEDPLFPLGDLEKSAAPAWALILEMLFGERTPIAWHATTAWERAYWLCAGFEALPSEENGDFASSIYAFPESGVYVLKDTLAKTELLFRTGPSANAAISAGHAHADLLSLCLSVNGHCVLVDPGTFTYRYTKKDDLPTDSPMGWRDYFAGPMSHNTLCIADTDPLGKMKADFRDPKVPVHARIDRSVSNGEIAWLETHIEGESTYAGYRRGIIAVNGHYIIVYDLLPAGVNHSWLGYQFAAGVVLEEQDNDAWQVTHKNAMARLLLFGGAARTVHTGSLSPLGGWVSPRYGVREAASQLRVDSSEFSRLIVTVLAGESDNPPIRISNVYHGTDRIKLDIALKNGIDSIQFALASCTDAHDLQWWRTKQGRCVEYRGLGIERWPEVVPSDGRTTDRTISSMVVRCTNGTWLFTHPSARRIDSVLMQEQLEVEGS